MVWHTLRVAKDVLPTNGEFRLLRSDDNDDSNNRSHNSHNDINDNNPSDHIHNIPFGCRRRFNRHDNS